MATQEQDYRSLSTHYLENGLRSLQEGDVEKTGEFLWGSMAAAVKAVAARRGLSLQSHRDIRRYARRLATEEGEPEIFGDFLQAEHLHANFYEVFLEREDLEAVVGVIRYRVAFLLQMPAERGDRGS